MENSKAELVGLPFCTEASLDTWGFECENLQSGRTLEAVFAVMDLHNIESESESESD